VHTPAAACVVRSHKWLGRLLTIPRDQDNVILSVDRNDVRLTNLRKIFWQELGLTKGDLLQYYTDVAAVLLPHLADRAMVMKRYPHGASGEFFFMKRAPVPRPDWVQICTIEHGSGNVIDFPMIQDRASLLWVINLGCIDLNQWYARCDRLDQPDYVHFDLDPGLGATFDNVREVALIVRDAPRRAQDAVAREDHRFERAARLRADRSRAGAETGMDVRKGSSPGVGRAPSGARHRPSTAWRKRPPRARAGGLQPERLGAHAGRQSIRSGRDRKRPCRRPSRGARLNAGSGLKTSPWRTYPPRVEALGDLWKPLLACKRTVRFDKVSMQSPRRSSREQLAEAIEVLDVIATAFMTINIGTASRIPQISPDPAPKEETDKNGDGVHPRGAAREPRCEAEPLRLL
jgi:bifunctional non-homologous end joining protein LigD